MTSREPKNILFSLDESRHCVKALSWLFKNILNAGDHLTVLCIIPDESARVSTMSRARTLLHATWDQCGSEAKMGIRIVVGQSIGKRICEVVDLTRPDLLVLGSAGKGHLAGFFMGSVSNYCIEKANCAVIVARMVAEEDHEDHSPVKRPLTGFWFEPTEIPHRASFDDSTK